MASATEALHPPSGPQPRRLSGKRILVATDGSESAARAVDWAATIAARCDAELHLIQVLVPQTPPATPAEPADSSRVGQAAQELEAIARGAAGGRGHGRVAVDPDPALAILAAAQDLGADVLVVGNRGMRGRKEFLLGNVPNRISHNARCTVVIVNTTPDPSPHPGASAPWTHPPPVPGSQDEDLHLTARAARIGAVMAKHGLTQLFSRGDAEDGSARTQARRLRAALEELGPTFAKLGQVLSTRPDLLPPVFIQELSALQDHVPPLTQEQVVTVMEQELGVPWEDVFDSIDPAPLAAGTIAQVHRATLTGGERVVVKVQRPAARTQIMRDLGLLRLFADKAARRPGLRSVLDVGAIVEHLSQSLQRELDFAREAANITRLGAILASYSRLGVPAVYDRYTTPRLLVMEEVQGIPLRRCPQGTARREAARQLLDSYYRQILKAGFFHADPHPGNLLWWNDKVYFLDFGMVGELGPKDRETLLLLLVAMWQGDAEFLTDVILMMSPADRRSEVDVAAFRAEMATMLARYRHQSVKDLRLGAILQDMSQIAFRQGVPLPAELVLTGKALAQVQLATAELDPDLDPFAMAGEALKSTVLSDLQERLDLRKLLYEGQKLKVRAARLLDAVESLTGARPGPKLQVEVRGVERVEQQIRRAGRRLALAVTAAGALVGAAVTASPDLAGWVPTTMGAAAAALVLGLVVDVVRGKQRGGR